MAATAAYVILFIDTEGSEGDLPTVVGAGIFGSPHITSNLKTRYPVVLFSKICETYAEAEFCVKEDLAAPHFAWVAKLIGPL